MLVDAYRRGAEPFWFYIIIFLPGIGSWVYFFAVKVRDFSHLRGGFLGPRRASLEELRYRVEQTPTLASNLVLGEALLERGLHEEANEPLEAALKLEPDHCQVLYSLAVCRSKLGRLAEAVPLVEKILARDRRWSDYKAWRMLIAVQSELNNGPAALASCRDLVRLAPSLEHHCLLADRLLAETLTDEAGSVLQEALESYRYAPGPIRRRDRRWAVQAQRLQKLVLHASRS